MIRRFFRSAATGRFIKKAAALLSPSTSIEQERGGVCGQKPVLIDERPDWYARLGAECTSAMLRGRAQPSYLIMASVKADDLSRALGVLNAHWGGCFPGEEGKPPKAGGK